MTQKLDFPVFDADNHLYETRDALTRYLPREYMGTIQYVEVNGRTKIVVRGHINEYIPNPTFDRVGRPGAQVEYWRHGNPDGKSMREIIGRGIECIPAWRNAGDRLTLLDQQGIDYALMYPTLASLIEESFTDDPDMGAAVVHSLNRWMLDEWPYDYKGRIFTTPLITPGEVSKAVAELEFVLEHGARAVLMRPSPAWGWKGPRSFALPEFDPYWKLIAETGTLVVFHSSASNYMGFFNQWEGVRTGYLSFTDQSPFIHAMGKHFREIQDATTSIICHGLCERFPSLRFALVENGAGWAPHMVHILQRTYGDMPHRFAEDPLKTLKRCFWLSPFHEEDPTAVVDLLGVENIVFGSDHPHVEGLEDPLSYYDELAPLPHTDRAKIMGGNMMGIFELAG